LTSSYNELVNVSAVPSGHVEWQVGMLWLITDFRIGLNGRSVTWWLAVPVWRCICEASVINV
jgi:hypothetical protein